MAPMKLFFSLTLLAFIVGCAEPLADKDMQFVGLWKSNQTSLLITKSGRLEYNSQKGPVETSISMPIKHISSAEIVGGFLFFKSTFTLSGPPVESNGVSVLVVDGETLFKAGALDGVLPVATMPSLTALRSVVDSDLRLFGAAILSNDFNLYRASASMMFQSQFTNEALQESYKTLIENNVNLNDWLVGDFELVKEPMVDADGILRVSGKYPTSPDSLKFSASYAYSHPHWKSFGLTLSIYEE